MNRPYRIDRFLNIVDRLRTNVPGMRISTDVIVGFREKLCRTLNLLKMHSLRQALKWFIFKCRSGTPSVNLDGKEKN